MFKSLTIYQLTQATDAVLKRLDAALESKPFAPCSDKQAISRGFVKPLGDDSEVISYSANGGTLFCLRTDEKALPAAAVKLLVADQVRELGDKLDTENKTDMRLLKEEITDRLLPGATPAPSWTFAYIDRELAMMFVGASEAGADEFVEAFKDAFKALPIMLLGVEEDPCTIFTEWLRNPSELGEVFTLGDSCSLKHAKEGGTANIQIQHDELDSDEIKEMLEAGKECCRIGLVHEDMSFAITSKLGIRSIQLSDDVKAEIAEDPHTSTQSSEFAAFVTVMRGVMRDLEPLLGGWPKQEILDLEDSEAAA